MMLVSNAIEIWVRDRDRARSRLYNEMLSTQKSLNHIEK